jgi:hypothetical protein
LPPPCLAVRLYLHQKGLVMPEYLIKTRDRDYWIGSVATGDPPEESLQLVQAERRWDWDPEGGPLKLAGTNLFLDLPQRGNPVGEPLELTNGRSGDERYWSWEEGEDGVGRIRNGDYQNTFITVGADHLLRLMYDGPEQGTQQHWTRSLHRA